MAAKKKDFSTVDTGRVYTAIEETLAEPQQATEPAADELREIREAGKTQGRKGCKAIRFNMAFTPTVYEYIKTMARVRGESVTDFTNYVFVQSMEENAELYEKAKQFTESFK